MQRFACRTTNRQDEHIREAVPIAGIATKPVVNNVGERRLLILLMKSTPELETERLRLRPHRTEDLDPACDMWADPIVTRYIGGKPSTIQQTWCRILSYRGHWALLGFGYWAVEEKVSGRFVGEVGFADFKRDIEPSMRGVPELGWAFASHVHGLGYGREAVGAAVAWGDGAFDGRRTVCLIDLHNVASIRVAESCGYLRFDRAAFNGRETLFLQRDERAAEITDVGSK